MHLEYAVAVWRERQLQCFLHLLMFPAKDIDQLRLPIEINLYHRIFALEVEHYEQHLIICSGARRNA